MEQNKSSKLNTVLLVVLIVLVIFGLYMMSNKKESQPMNETPTDQTQVNTNPNGNDYQPQNLKEFQGQGFSFKYDSNSNVTVPEGARSDLIFYNVDNGSGYPDSINFFTGSIPKEFGLCSLEYGGSPVTINGKNFVTCNSTAEPAKTYIYTKNGKNILVFVQLASFKSSSLIDLGSIEIN